MAGFCTPCCEASCARAETDNEIEDVGAIVCHRGARDIPCRYSGGTSRPIEKWAEPMLDTPRKPAGY
jgi:hypothetical protein